MQFDRRNLWECPHCKAAIEGGIVFVTGISGSAVERCLGDVVGEARKHNHKVQLHDIGHMMRKFAEDDDPDVRWEKILDQDERVLRYLRSQAFLKLTHEIESKRDTLHLVDLHLSFRWKAYLMKGFEPHVLDEFKPLVRCFVNVICDLVKVQEQLKRTSWGERQILELLIWRDEELFLTDLFSDACGRVSSLAIAEAEPPGELEKVIWHPGVRRVYLSFPITHIREDAAARQEIEAFRDKLRDFLVVFDPRASTDYDETYARQEMAALKKQVGEATEERDYRFINQAEAVVVYYPRKVPSKGVDAEMNHARRTGKPMFLYCPEDPGGGPFAVPPTHSRTSPDELIDLLKKELSPRPSGT
jgi:adenylate kinase